MSTYIYDGKQVQVPTTAQLIASLSIRANKPSRAIGVRRPVNDYPTRDAQARELTEGESWTVWKIAEEFPQTASSIALAWSRGWAAHMDSYLSLGKVCMNLFNRENAKYL